MKSILCFILAMIGFAASTLLGQVSTPTALQTAITSASQGDVISLSGIDPLNCPEAGMSQTWNGGKLIFSDSPESPTTTGMLYEDTNVSATASGISNRFFVYHENNNSSSHMKFSVLIKNNGSSSGTLKVTQSGFTGPSTDFPYLGKLAFYRWLTNTSTSSMTVTAGQIVRLDTNFDSTLAAQGYAMHGIWDYTFNQPHTIMICALNPTDNPITVGPTLPLLARDGHERGTFAYCNKIYNTASGVTINTTNGILQFPVGENDDTNITGLDNSVYPPTLETNEGDYGVLYRQHLTTASGDGQTMGILITPRAGEWGGAIFTEAGISPGGTFLIPGSDATFSDETEAAVAGKYTLGSSFTIHWQFMPTAGVSFPVRFMTVPY